jgi:hypothetical protein
MHVCMRIQKEWIQTFTNINKYSRYSLLRIVCGLYLNETSKLNVINVMMYVQAKARQTIHFELYTDLTSPYFDLTSDSNRT